MKHIKKVIICMLAIALLSGNMMPYVEAAEGLEETVQPRKNEEFVWVEKENVTAWFKFTYVDGSSVTFIGCGTDLERPLTVTKNVFSGDSRIVEAYLIIDGKKITFGAWCDIYGQKGGF